MGRSSERADGVAMASTDAGTQRTSGSRDAGTHLWIEVVDALNGLDNVALLDGLPDGHPVLDALEICLLRRRRCHPRLACKVLGGLLVALDDEVVHDEPIEVAV